MLNIPLRSAQISWLFRVALLVNLVAISCLAMTGSKVQVAALFTDKINHFTAFFVLSYCLDRGFPQLRFLIYKLAPLVLYGLLIELVQSLLPHRDFSLLDFLADCAAIGVYWLLRQPLRRLLVAKKE
jgi:VanZ family protein